MTIKTTPETAQAAADTASAIRQKIPRDIEGALGIGPVIGLGLQGEITEDDPDHQTPRGADRVRSHHATGQEKEKGTETGRGEGKGTDIETGETMTATDNIAGAKTGIETETGTGKETETAGGTAHQKDIHPGEKLNNRMTPSLNKKIATTSAASSNETAPYLPKVTPSPSAQARNPRNPRRSRTLGTQACSPPSPTRSRKPTGPRLH